MQRTQVYLTNAQITGLKALAAETGTSKNELIREAVDNLLAMKNEASWKQALEDAFGLWSDVPDLDERMAEIRREFDANIPDR